MVIYSYKLLKNLHLTLRNQKKKWNLIKNTPGIRKKQPRTEIGIAEKAFKSNEQPIPLGFDRFESVHHY